MSNEKTVQKGSKKKAEKTLAEKRLAKKEKKANKSRSED